MDKMMDTLYELKELIMRELDQIVEKGDMSSAEIDNTKDAVKVIKMICEMEDEYDSGYSQRNYYIEEMPERWNRNNSYASGRNYRGGRYSMRGGRSYDNGYSRHGGDNEYMIRNLEKAMDEATTDKERQMISECIDKLSK